MRYPKEYGVIVIGGGHAGTEAALASARMGVPTLLLSHNIETLGQMSCNPAIGGIGKSHLVKEVDALGGAMASATDKAGIQFRILNSRKGPAVRATRAQADRVLYKAAIRDLLENQDNLDLFQQSCDDLIVEGEKVKGVVTATGIEFYAERIVLTAGTFLGGKIHIGLDQSSGGRAGDPPSIRLAERLRELPFEVGRLKTGTPPRIDAKSVDFSVMTEQPGDTPLPVMSYWGSVEEHPQQVSCYITHTNEKTHDIIREGLDRSPMYTGVIEGIGPRYCPSIEDKIHRFADKNSHQIFIEPEGLRTHELYPNGVSTSLPFDIQVRLIQSMKGMGNAHIMRPGYAIEYDYFDPRGLKSTLETRCLEGLYFAGQINGTTGYEEAAAQGLLAGANAALAYQQKPSWSPKRSEAYLGVLVDDLISNGTSEPYRMFTSRAEHRLILREDNADLRLSEFAYQAGLLPEEKYALFAKKQDMVEKIKGSMESTWVQPESDRAKALAELSKSDFKKPANEFSLLKRPELKISDILDVSSFDEQLTQLGLADDFPRQVFEQIEIQAKYSGYIGRQEDEIKSMKAFENTLIPTDFDYGRVKGLSNEILSKLEVAKPETLAQASRVSGVTPAAISLIMIYLKKQMGVKLQKKTH